jgi:hypothetical protein
MNTYGKVKLVTSALDGGEWLASRPGRFTRRGKSQRYQLDRRVGGSQNWSGCYEENNLALRGIELGPSNHVGIPTPPAWRLNYENFSRNADTKVCPAIMMRSIERKQRNEYWTQSFRNICFDQLLMARRR